jgi:two-component system KDP operon response regulator KdpE
MTTILVVDDEPAILRALSISLTARGYTVLTATNGTDGLRVVADDHPAVIVLDLGLPDLDGVEVIRRLRTWSTAPVLVLSARDQESQKVAALDAGADDYVTKPFGMHELLARLRAAVRRSSPSDEPEALVRTENFVVDLAGKQVQAAGQRVRLTPTEWQMLETLAKHAGRLVTSKQLLHEVWGPAYGTETNYLRVYMAQLRRKLEPDPSRPVSLLTEPGMGYRLVALDTGDA